MVGSWVRHSSNGRVLTVRLSVGRRREVPHGVQRIRTDQRQQLGGATGLKRRRVGAVNQMKPANIAALRDPETRRAFAEAVGTAMGDWVSARPAAGLEERAEAFRVIPPAKALEVCGKRERREEGWFAGNREVLVELVAVRNRAEVVWRRQQGQAAHTRLKEARKRPEAGGARGRDDRHRGEDRGLLGNSNSN